MSRMKTFKTVTGSRLGETGKAVKFEIQKIGEIPVEPSITTWFPFSQVDKSFTNPNETNNDYLIVSEWILKEKGLLVL